MARGISIATIVGNITKDIELKTTASGKEVVSFSVAVNKSKDEVEYFDCVAWSRAAETLATYAKKGTAIFINGNLQYRSWEKDGVSHKRAEVVVDKFTLLGGRDSPAPQVGDVAPKDISSDPIDLSEIPF